MPEDKVLVFDTTLRDGEQAPGASLSIPQKLEIAQQLATLGVDIIEAGFPVSSPGQFEATRLIAEEVQGPVIAGLARTVAKDIEAAAKALEPAKRWRIHTFTSSSPQHVKHMLRMTLEEVLTKAVDRGTILLIVYAAFSVGMTEHIWSSVQPWRVVAVAVVSTVLLGIVLGITAMTGRLARLDRGDTIVLVFCGSKKSLASGLPMALVLFPPATVGLIMLPLMLFHQIQLFVCAVIASRLSRSGEVEAGNRA